jgi:hypothetical protein
MPLSFSNVHIEFGIFCDTGSGPTVRHPVSKTLDEGSDWVLFDVLVWLTIEHVREHLPA